MPRRLSDSHYVSASVVGALAGTEAAVPIFVAPHACTILSVSAALDTAATGTTTAKVDVNKNGTTIFTTQASRPIFVASAKNATVSTPDVTALAAGDYLTFDVDAKGSTIAGSNLVVTVEVE